VNVHDNGAPIETFRDAPGQKKEAFVDSVGREWRDIAAWRSRKIDLV